MKKYLNYLHNQEKVSMFLGIVLGLVCVAFFEAHPVDAKINYIVFAENENEGVESLLTETVEITNETETQDVVSLATLTTVKSNLVSDDTIQSLETRTVIVGGIEIEEQSLEDELLTEVLNDLNIEETLMEQTIEDIETENVLNLDESTKAVEEQENKENTADEIMEEGNIKGVPNSIEGCRSYNITYMPYTAVTSVNSGQYKLLYSDACYTDPVTGIRMVDGRYCVAVGTYYARTIGTKLDLVFSNGRVVNCILGDVKADKHTDSTNRYHSVDGSVAEFVVDYDYFSSTSQWSNLCGGTIDSIIIVE